MGNLFGKPKVSAYDRAVFELKNQRDTLDKQQKQMAVIIDRENELARRMAHTNRAVALLAIKRRKYQEGLIKTTRQYQDNITTLIDTMAETHQAAEVSAALQKGTSELKKIQKQLDIGVLRKMEEETREAIEYQREINEFLGDVLSVDDSVAAEEECDALFREIAEEEALKASVDLAKVPATAVKRETTEEPQVGQSEAL